jgi:hypothetical protein
MSVFADYDCGDFFDEAHDGQGSPRPHYQTLVDQMGAFPPGELARRERLRDEAFRTAGITFTVYGESEGVERTFPLDLVPRVIPHDEWDHIERGLVQRITVLNRFLEDLYVGERAVVRDGVIPWWFVDALEAIDVEDRQGSAGAVPQPTLERDREGTTVPDPGERILVRLSTELVHVGKGLETSCRLRGKELQQLDRVGVEVSPSGGGDRQQCRCAALRAQWDHHDRARARAPQRIGSHHAERIVGSR